MIYFRSQLSKETNASKCPTERIEINHVSDSSISEACSAPATGAGRSFQPGSGLHGNKEYMGAQSQERVGVCRVQLGPPAELDGTVLGRKGLNCVAVGQ